MYYSNGFDSTYEELISYYPAFYRNVKEMRAILETQGRICDNCVSAINAIFENCFIESADEATISRLEAFLEIQPTPNSTLEERRRYVRAYFVGFGKISASKLKEIIRAFTGADSKITFGQSDEKGNNTLLIEIERGNNTDISYKDIESNISKRLPAHIDFKTIIKYRFPVVVSRQRSNHPYEYKLCGTCVAGMF